MKVSDYMKLKLNNKGYMLVEIILASAIAFGLAFFIIDLTIKLKNKNDDLMVETLMNTDRTIINNKLMSYAKEEEANFDCSKLTIDKNTIKYKENDKENVIDNVNVYGKIDWDKMECSTDNGKISIKIPIDIPQMPDKEYDIIFDYKYEIGDMTAPTCSLETDGTTIKATYSDNEGGSGITYYGWDSAYTGDNSDSKSIAVGTHTYYVKDKAGNSKSCSMRVFETDTSYTKSTRYCNRTSYKCNCKTCGGDCKTWGPYSNWKCTNTWTNSPYGDCHDSDADGCVDAGFKYNCRTRSCNSFNPTYDCNCQTCYNYAFEAENVSSVSDCSDYKFDCNSSNYEYTYVSCSDPIYSCSSGIKINDNYCYEINE